MYFSLAGCTVNPHEPFSCCRAQMFSPVLNRAEVKWSWSPLEGDASHPCAICMIILSILYVVVDYFFFTLEFATSNNNKKKTYIGEIVSEDHSPSDRWWWKFVPFLWRWRLYWLVLALDVTFNTSLSEVAAIHFLSPLFSTQGHTVLGSVSGRRWSSTIDWMWMDEVIGMPLVCHYQEA